MGAFGFTLGDLGNASSTPGTTLTVGAFDANSNLLDEMPVFENVRSNSDLLFGGVVGDGAGFTSVRLTMSNWDWSIFYNGFPLAEAPQAAATITTPEPSSLALWIGVGMLGLAGAARRRRRIASAS